MMDEIVVYKIYNEYEKLKLELYFLLNLIVYTNPSKEYLI